MSLNLPEFNKEKLTEFYEATDPNKTLLVEDQQDYNYYIDFSSVQGGNLIKDLKNHIKLSSNNKPTCQLFTGYIGCGKSTALLRLKAELKEDNFYVIYFESSKDLEIIDVDVCDIFLAVTRRIIETIENLEDIDIGAEKLNKIKTEASKLLEIEIDILSEPGTVSETGKIRKKSREYLGREAQKILEAINKEILNPFQEELNKQEKKGLVLIVDNLDPIRSDRRGNQPQYLFLEKAEYLRQLNCHVIYTMPLSLIFSNDLSKLTQRFGVRPKVLPMVPVKLRNGKEDKKGMELLQQMVLTRAFPNIKPDRRVDLIGKLIEQVFDSSETLDRLCQVSGGHLRNLMMFINEWIQKEQKVPLTRKVLEQIIKDNLNQMKLAIDDHEWKLLCQVLQDKKVSGNEEYQKLIESMFVYEYRNSEGSWFDINPILAEAGELKSGLTVGDMGDYIDSKIIDGLNSLQELHEDYLKSKDYVKAADTANSAYEMCVRIADSLDQKIQKEIYQRVIALSSYWKLQYDLYRGLAQEVNNYGSK